MSYTYSCDNPIRDITLKNDGSPYLFIMIINGYHRAYHNFSESLVRTYYI